MTDFVDTEQLGFLLDTAKTDVAKSVIRLAMGKPKVSVGTAYTGKREYFWCSRTGTYRESMPILSADERFIQAVLTTPLPKPWWHIA